MHFRGLFMGCILVAMAGQAQTQTKEQRPTGLPTKVQWTFNLDAGLGAFGFGHSLYTDVRPDPSGDLSDNWFESYVKPAVSARYHAGKGEFFGKISAVGERTYSAPPPLVGTEASSFMVEDLYIGWRSGTALSVGENALEFTLGRAQYKIGHGLLLWDGGGEGGSRGGFWSNARKAWAFAGIARYHVKQNTLEAFYLDRNEVPEAETGTKVAGANYERAIGDATTLGASYLHFIADSSLPSRDGLNVFNVRAYTAPLRRLPNLSFEAEYARENNGDLRQATAWNFQGAYELPKRPWKPKLSYRYAFFQGDDPATSANESFDMLLPGFYDWGTWWQGEIGGEYFLANANLISHQLRVHVKPTESIGGGLIGYAFKLDQMPTGITSKDVATELDAYTDWSVNGNFIVSFVAAFAHPQAAATQAYQRTSNFTYGMIYVAYSY